jgi:hypothetical protein
VRPAARLTVGRLRYDVQLAGVTVMLAVLPEPNVATALLPAAVRFEAVPGEEAGLDLTGLALADGDTATVLTGVVHAVRRSGRWTEVELVDAGAALTRARPPLSRSAGTAADVVSALLDAAGAGGGTVELDLPLAGYVADQSRTAAEHIALLAGLGGALSTVDGAGAVVVRAPTGPDVALLHGRELIDLWATESAPEAALVTVGAGPAGSGQAPDALRPSTRPLPDGAPDPAADTVWRATPVLRTPTAARAATDAAGDAAAARASRLHARAVLLPALRPGVVVQVREAPSGSGDWLVTRVRHRVLPARGGFTEFDAVAAASVDGGLGGLL